ncbi:MAG: hypothetical protein Q7S32_02200 [bacterium]|nr:hypothetical protein [bacterium]
MRFRSGALILLLLFSTGCVRIFSPGRPSIPKAPLGKNQMAAANDYLKVIDYYDVQVRALDAQISIKRTDGYNTSAAETIHKEMEEKVESAKALTFERKFSELENVFKAIDEDIKRVKAEVKKAPRFGNEPAKKPVKQARKFLDDRDWVKEIRGEPQRSNKQSRYPTTLELRFFNPPASITQSMCWNSIGQAFVLQNPPSVETWYYQEDQTMYVFMETNSIVEQFMLRNELPENELGILLSNLCMAQTYSSYKLIYAGPPITDASFILEQIFGAKMRSADMFGVGAISRLARATAALPDLAVASVAFDTAFYGLNKLQSAQFDKLFDLMAIQNPEAVGVMFGVSNKEGFDKFYANVQAAGKSSVFLEEVKKIREGIDVDEVKGKKISKLIDNQSKEFKKRLQVLKKVSKWNQTMSPGKGEMQELASLYPDKDTEIYALAAPFRETILKITANFGILRRDLLRFKKQWPELVFSHKDYISIFFLLEGVSFHDKPLPNGGNVEEPDLSFKVVVKMMQGKYDPPVFVKESEETKIKNANRYIDEVKEYRRLASFGIIFPFRLPPGRYEITMFITDNLRAKTVQQELIWQISEENEP